MDSVGFGPRVAGLALIDPLVFPLSQKSTSRTEIYGGLGLMSPQEVSQYNTLQQRCADAIVNGATNMTQQCSAAEDFMSATTGLDLQDIRKFQDSEGAELIDQYFNGQTTEVTLQILATLNIDVNLTPKKPPNKIWYSDPGVYEALSRSNDIYG
jgi:hypothetical protein